MYCGLELLNLRIAGVPILVTPLRDSDRASLDITPLNHPLSRHLPPPPPLAKSEPPPSSKTKPDSAPISEPPDEGVAVKRKRGRPPKKQSQPVKRVKQSAPLVSAPRKSGSGPPSTATPPQSRRSSKPALAALPSSPTPDVIADASSLLSLSQAAPLPPSPSTVPAQPSVSPSLLPDRVLSSLSKDTLLSSSTLPLSPQQFMGRPPVWKLDSLASIAARQSNGASSESRSFFSPHPLPTSFPPQVPLCVVMFYFFLNAVFPFFAVITPPGRSFLFSSTPLTKSR